MTPDMWRCRFGGVLDDDMRSMGLESSEPSQRIASIVEHEQGCSVILLGSEYLSLFFFFFFFFFFFSKSLWIYRLTRGQVAGRGLGWGHSNELARRCLMIAGLGKLGAW